MSKNVAKVPMIMQMEALECGAASLTMILAYHGKWLPLEKVRADCDVSRDGSNARNILKAARNYGLKAQGYRLEPEELKKQNNFPCIIHWNFNHFLVLDGFKNDKAVLNDPARGLVQVSMEEFDNSFTGICLMFEPSESFEKGGKPKSMLTFAKSRLVGSGVAFAFVILTSLISSVISVVNPAFSRVFLDRILTGEDPNWLVPMVGILSCLVFIQILVQALNAVYSLRIQGKFGVVANSSFFWHVLRLPVNFFSQRMCGDIASRQQSNEGIAGTLLGTLAPMLINFALLLVYLTVMLRYSLLLSVVGIGTVVLNIVVSRIITLKKINITRVVKRDRGKLQGETVNGLDMIETIKASGAEAGFFERWSGYQASVFSQEFKYQRVNMVLGAIPAFLNQLANIAVLMLGVYLCLQGQFTPGMILAFQGYLTAFMAPASSLVNSGQAIQEMRTDMERIDDVMNYVPDVYYNQADAEKAGTETFEKLKGTIEMRNVTFGYNKLSPPLIENFSMKVEPGSSVAFVGPSGCGKSTLSKLISGLYKPWSGEILFDGKPIGEIPHEVFTSSLSVVDQDIVLFEDTIANNIKMWDKSIADFEMVLAARDADIHSDIIQRSEGYQHVLAEDGKDFSGGQRQRLEIARVLAQDPSIIIMDEATSALDSKTEFSVVNNIRERGITSIVVAHRLSTIRDCEEIIVMERGKVIERGKHEDLFNAGGLYAQLVSND